MAAGQTRAHHTFGCHLPVKDNLSRYSGIAAYGIHQASDLLNLDFHPVPGLHKEWRGTFFSDTSGRTGQNDISRRERAEGADIRNEFGN